ncbi:MAG: PQQ-binding-like beta-propeller repeat protein [Acidimicrobiia bacterium]
MTHREPTTPAARVAVAVVLMAMVAAMVGAALFVTRGSGTDLPAPLPAASTIAPDPVGAEVPPETTATSSTSSSTSSTTTTTTLPLREPGTVPGFTVGRPWGEVVGLTMFRGNPTRSFYGTGPLPADTPVELWSYPADGPMCGSSTVAGESRQWCGSGWTGQPVVWERPDGGTEVIFGAYDKAVHFLDAATGEETRPSFPVGDIIKGSVTLDPDGFPLLYTGSRDNKMRVIALDRDVPTELWSIDASAVPGIWNDDWDGNPAIVDDIMFIGGENSWFFAILLNRSYDGDGSVVVDPEVVFQMPGYTDELLALVGRNVSIESSVALFEERLYFTNSGGRVVGLDISNVRQGEAPVVFDYWAGDDIDATPVIDSEGMLYIAIEDERKNERSREVGQLIKLDPYTDGDPRVWGVADPGGSVPGGIWATPALGDGFIYVGTETGRLLAVDATTGEVTWEDSVGPHAWSSPAIIDGVLLLATCEPPELRAYSLDNPALPEPIWTMAPAAGGCLESTPAVWEGRIYVGSRDGYFRAYGD